MACLERETTKIFQQAILKSSSPEVGSSRRMMEGLMSSSCPTDTRLRSPPEMPL